MVSSPCPIGSGWTGRIRARGPEWTPTATLTCIWPSPPRPTVILSSSTSPGTRATATSASTLSATVVLTGHELGEGGGERGASGLQQTTHTGAAGRCSHQSRGAEGIPEQAHPPALPCSGLQPPLVSPQRPQGNCPQWPGPNRSVWATLIEPRALGCCSLIPGSILKA